MLTDVRLPSQDCTLQVCSIGAILETVSQTKRPGAAAWLRALYPGVSSDRLNGNRRKVNCKPLDPSYWLADLRTSDWETIA